MAYSIDSYQTQKGKRYRVRYLRPDGKQTTKRGFQRKMDAQQWGDAYVNAAKIDGTYVTREAGAMTVRQIYRQWMEARRPALKESTTATDERIWRTHIEREYGTRMIRTLTHAEIQAYISGKATGLSPSTVSKIYGVIKGICDTAVKDHRISRSPADDIILPRREGRRLHRYLTVDQLLAVADEAGHAIIQPDSKRAIVLLLGFCGLRWGEMCGLKVEDIDFARQRIHVRRNVTRIGGEWVETTPKSHEMRDVPMPRIVGDALLQATKDKQDGDFVFRTPDGKPPRNQSASGKGVEKRGAHAYRANRTWFVSACLRAGVEPLPPHDLRHTAASIAVHAGANVKALQRMLGHRQASMTLDVYADLFDSDLDDVARVIDATVDMAGDRTWSKYGQDTPSGLLYAPRSQ